MQEESKGLFDKNVLFFRRHVEMKELELGGRFEREETRQ